MNCLSLVVVTLAMTVVSARHYRGGTFSWKPAEDDKVDITWRVSWMRDYDYRFECSDQNLNIVGEGRLLCMECRQHDIYGKELDLHCTSWDQDENWSTGVGTFRYTPEPGMRQFTLSFQESTTPNVFNYNSQWIREMKNYGGAGNAWRMVTTVDLDIPNKSPTTTHPAMITLMKECGDVSIKIPVSDANNYDDVKCRWTNKDNECPQKACNPKTGVCEDDRVCGNPFPGATIDENECVYSFPVSQMEPGWYAVPITLEDHRRGVTGRLESGALSKIPLQFLIKVESKGECRSFEFDYKQCQVIHPDQEWTYELKVYSSAVLKSMVVERPNREFNITPLRKHANYYSRVISWTPKVSDTGTYFVLFHAVDRDGYYSSYETLTIVVEELIDIDLQKPPEVLPEQSIPAPFTEVTPTLQNWKIKFDKAVVRPNEPAYISIMDSKGNVAARYDVSDKRQVKITKNKPDVMSIDSPYEKLKPGTAYLLIVDPGTAGQTCVDSCGNICPGTTPTETVVWSIITPPIPEPAVECGPSSLSVYIPHDYIDGVGPDKLRFIDTWDEDCYAKSHNSTHYKMKTGFEECGTIAEEQTPGRLIFKNIVRDVPKPIADGLPVTRTQRKIKINVTCEVEGLSYYDVSFTPSDSVEAFIVRGKSRLNTLLKLYDDETYTREYRKEDLPTSVELMQKLFFGLEAVNKAKDLQIISCTATQREKLGCKPDQYTFIKDGCPVDSTVRFERPVSRYQMRFSVEAFSFLFYGSTEEVLVRCKTAICKPGDLDSICTQLEEKSCPSDTILVPSKLDMMSSVAVPVSG